MEETQEKEAEGMTAFTPIARTVAVDAAAAVASGMTCGDALCLWTTCIYGNVVSIKNFVQNTRLQLLNHLIFARRRYLPTDDCIWIRMSMNVV